jgi:hypothetical protein
MCSRGDGKVKGNCEAWGKVNFLVKIYSTRGVGNDAFGKVWMFCFTSSHFGVRGFHRNISRNANETYIRSFPTSNLSLLLT